MKNFIKVIGLSLFLLVFVFSINSSLVKAQTLKPTIKVLSPNGGEVYKVGDSVDIRWSTNNFGSLKLWLTLADKNGDSTSKTLFLNASNIPNTGSYIWNIPKDAPLGTYKIVASSLDNGPSAYDFSDSYFTIVSATSTATTTPNATTTKPVIKVLSPNGGELWKEGSTQKITWSANHSNGVRINLVRYGTFFGRAYAMLKEVIDPNATSTSIVVPKPAGFFVFGYRYKVEIQDLKNPNISDESDNYFSIIPELRQTIPTPTPESIANSSIQIIKPVAEYNYIDNGSNAPNKAVFKFQYEIINNSNKDIYVSKNTNPVDAVSILSKSRNIPDISLSKVYFISAEGIKSGDTAKASVIPAGTSRIFTMSGTITNEKNLDEITTSVEKIYYSTDYNFNSRYVLSKENNKQMESLAVKLFFSTGSNQNTTAPTNTPTPTLNPSTLTKTIRLGQSINQVFVAENIPTGKNGSWNSWSVAKGDLPPGVSLNQSGAFSGSILGTPTTTGTYNFMIRGYDTADNLSAYAWVYLTVTSATSTATQTSAPTNSPAIVSITSHKNGQAVYMDDYLNDGTSYAKEEFIANTSITGNYFAEWTFHDVSGQIGDQKSSDTRYVLGSLVKVTQAFTRSGTYTVSLQIIDAKGNKTTSSPITIYIKEKQATQSTPTISYISPTSGPIGTQVKIYGSNFSSTDNTVYLKNGSTNYSISTLLSINNSITFTIPSWANGYYNIVVENNQLMTSGATSFTVTVPQTTPTPTPTPTYSPTPISTPTPTPTPTPTTSSQPLITSLSAYSTNPGSKVTINGTGFTSTDNTVYLKNGSTNYPITALPSTNGSIVFTIPSWANGTYSITVENNNLIISSNSISLTVTAPSSSPSPFASPSASATTYTSSVWNALKSIFGL